jgi:hypothetical protein
MKPMVENAAINIVKNLQRVARFGENGRRHICRVLKFDDLAEEDPGGFVLLFCGLGFSRLEVKWGVELNPPDDVRG